MDRMLLWENVSCNNDSTHSCSPYVLSERNKPIPLGYQILNSLSSAGTIQSLQATRIQEASEKVADAVGK